jgi:alpha-L-rhamnosidase
VDDRVPKRRRTAAIDRSWTARLISAGADAGADRRRPVRFRRAFRLPGAIVSADLLVTACGVYRAFVNGRAVGDHVLAPGWTSYRHRHFVQSFSVAGLLVTGENAIGIEVGEGWYRGRLGWKQLAEHYGTEIGPIAELCVTADDGTRTLLATDAAWRCAPSATLAASLYDGEEFDQRLDDDWTQPAYDDRAWRAATVCAFDTAALRLESVPPVRRIEERAPVAITRSPSGATLVDFGQNVVGRLRIALPAEPDCSVILRHAEVLEHGELGTRPLRTAAATDVVHTAGRAGTAWEPAFTFHGFRYVEVRGWPGEPTRNDLRAIVCHTDLDPIGAFSCSDPLLDRLHENVRWSAKGNFLSVPTDCPQRDERLGWTGDLQVFAPTACFLFDCRAMLRSWLEDLACEQAANDGVVAMIVPELPKLVPAIPFAGWGDAAVIVPWVLYERFGDAEVLDAQYASMRSWVEAVAARSDEDGLWRGKFQFGDWLDPAAPPEDPAGGRTDRHLVAAAYQVHCVRLLARVAAVLGRGDDADRYGRRAGALHAAFAAAYAAPSGRMRSDSPTAYALALCFDLVEGAQRAVAARRLCELVEADRFRIGTGFLGTPLVCDALVAAGAPDHAWRLLTQTACPSWLYAVTMGATTIWERWDSMLPDGSINPGEMTSFNHYAFGAVADFLHRRVAGLAPGAPGYRVLDVEPLPGGGLTWAHATHQTPFGDAAVRWERDGSRFSLELTVPDACTARVRLPDGSAPAALAAGVHRLHCRTRSPEDDPRSSGSETA